MTTIDTFRIIKPRDKIREVKMNLSTFLIIWFSPSTVHFARIRKFNLLFDVREGEILVATEISRDPPGYPDRRLHRNYRHFMNQTHAYRRPRDYS